MRRNDDMGMICADVNRVIDPITFSAHVSDRENDNGPLFGVEIDWLAGHLFTIVFKPRSARRDSGGSKFVIVTIDRRLLVAMQPRAICPDRYEICNRLVGVVPHKSVCKSQKTRPLPQAVLTRGEARVCLNGYLTLK
jgi:hypothetical protein